MKYTLILLAFSCCFYLSNACTCIPSPPNGCQSDYSILAQVVGAKRIGTSPGGSNIYTVVVWRIFKWTKGLRHVIHIRSAVSSAACGVNLTVGKSYVISGSANRYKFRTNSCQFVREWPREIPASQRRSLYCRKRGYGYANY